ncbi:MAG TPA: MFS transporter, partial [Verrucomicrobiae bacterium]|nr:MFS transporter [Verrucomicrobiae bacterium]
MIERPIGAEEPVSALAVFRNRPFLILWLSQVATQVGGNMVLYGLTVLVFTASGSNSAVSILLISFLAPAVVFGAVAGVYVDRFDRRLVLVATSLVRSGLFFILAFVGANVGLILLANLMVSIATTFFAPAELSVIP